MSEDSKKFLENKYSEYFEERKILNKKKERYLKNGKEVPDKLNKRITECDIILDYFNTMIRNIECLEFEHHMNAINSTLLVPTLDGFGNGVITY